MAISAIEASYTAASALPIKLMLNPEVEHFLPVHVQWFPTNHCNLHCKFCSCEYRDHNVQMDLDEARRVINELAELGCKAVTISGGGEPLCHSGLTTMLDMFACRGISIGLVTNGLLLDAMEPEALQALTWCRVSNSDSRKITPRYREQLAGAVESAPSVDWAFSHVVGRTPNYEEIRRIVRFADEHNFTHVRLVADLSEPDAVYMDAVRSALKGIDRRVIYQARRDYSNGSPCMICYIKPVIAADFGVYPCCGVQYAFDPMPMTLPDSTRMGDARYDLREIWNAPLPRRFGCKRCYYGEYNCILNAIHGGVKHREFL